MSCELNVRGEDVGNLKTLTDTYNIRKLCKMRIMYNRTASSSALLHQGVRGVVVVEQLQDSSVSAESLPFPLPLCSF